MTLTASLDRPDRVETVAAEKVAEVLLERMRETPMRRGALPRRARTLRTAIARAIASQSVPEPLSRRIAFQLAFKLSARELHGRDVWEAVGRILRADILCLRERLGLTDHKIVGVLPKLSATRILEFLEELTRADRRIARTILNAAVDAADPLAAGRRYLASTPRRAAAASDRPDDGEDAGECDVHGCRPPQQGDGTPRPPVVVQGEDTGRPRDGSPARPRGVPHEMVRRSARRGRGGRVRFSKHGVELGHRCA